jgi:rod shape-determining protein MreC
MRNLLDFLSKYSFFFLFIFLEVICLILIYNNNYFQRSRIVSTTGGMTGNINIAFNDISEYLHLRTENRLLARENAFLRQYLKIKTPEQMDSLENITATQDVSFISAKIINNTVQKRSNYFMMDRGWADGVKKDMGVISADGVVGIVIDVSQHFSSGISILHKDMKISGRVRKNQHLVNVSWEGRNYRHGKLEDIPTHVELTDGDTIQTSGNSHIFPEGIMIGTVIKVHETDELFKSADIEFSVDYNKLYYVYIIENIYKEELIQINPSL